MCLPEDLSGECTVDMPARHARLPEFAIEYAHEPKICAWNQGVDCLGDESGGSFALQAHNPRPEVDVDMPTERPQGYDMERVGCFYGTKYELLDERLFFTFHRDREFTLSEIKRDRHAFFFSSVLPDCYENFCADFGPTHISLIVRFCREIKSVFNHPKLRTRQLVYYCACTFENVTNTALMMGAYLMLEHGMTPDEAISPFLRLHPCPLQGFRDATSCEATFLVHILDCLHGLRKALHLSFLTPNPSSLIDDFDCESYELYYDPRALDLNRVTPKFIACAGPSTKCTDDDTYYNRPPKDYVQTFRKFGVTMVVRLNEPDTYDAKCFTDNGIAHTDLYFEDCTSPDVHIVKKFLDLCDRTEGCIAVHCLAGLGRTGTLIAVYLIKNYGFTAREAIGYLRLMRPGSVIGPQQHFLEAVERCEWYGNTMSLSKEDAKLLKSVFTTHLSKRMAQQVFSAFKERRQEDVGIHQHK